MSYHAMAYRELSFQGCVLLKPQSTNRIRHRIIAKDRMQRFLLVPVVEDLTRFISMNYWLKMASATCIARRLQTPCQPDCAVTFARLQPVPPGIPPVEPAAMTDYELNFLVTQSKSKDVTGKIHGTFYFRSKRSLRTDLARRG